jgi:hypothetical protein
VKEVEPLELKKVAVPRLTAYIFYLLLPGRDPLFLLAEELTSRGIVDHREV